MRHTMRVHGRTEKLVWLVYYLGARVDSDGTGVLRISSDTTTVKADWRR